MEPIIPETLWNLLELLEHPTFWRFPATSEHDSQPLNQLYIYPT